MNSDSQFFGLETAEWNVTLHGQSYLYPFDPSVPRNCENQRVPFEFCICGNNKAQDVSEAKQPLAKRMAAFVVRHINDFLRTQQALDVCSELLLHPEKDVELFRFTSNAGLHRIVLRTLPNGGRYETYVKVSENIDLLD